jgi:hypothetical protein
MQLHFVLCSMLSHNKIEENSKMKLPPNIRKMGKKNIASLVVEMRKDYIRVRKNARNDIEYAFAACISACELILLSSKEPSEKAIMASGTQAPLWFEYTCLSLPHLRAFFSNT